MSGTDVDFKWIRAKKSRRLINMLKVLAKEGRAEIKCPKKELAAKVVKCRDQIATGYRQ